MPNHLRCYLVVNGFIEILCNDVIRRLPKNSISNMILVNICNDRCCISVTNHSIQNLWLVLTSWLGAAAPVLYPLGTADGGEVRPLSSCLLLGRVMAAMGCRSLSFFFSDGATAARRVRSPPLLWRRGDGDQARWLPAGSSGGRVTAVRLGCSPPAPLV